MLSVFISLFHVRVVPGVGSGRSFATLCMRKAEVDLKVVKRCEDLARSIRLGQPIVPVLTEKEQVEAERLERVLEKLKNFDPMAGSCREFLSSLRL